jgi:hypothetical protein
MSKIDHIGFAKSRSKNLLSRMNQM